MVRIKARPLGASSFGPRPPPPDPYAPRYPPGPHQQLYDLTHEVWAAAGYPDCAEVSAAGHMACDGSSERGVSPAAVVVVVCVASTRR